MQDKKYLLNSLIGITLLLLLFSFVFIIYDSRKGITGMAVSGQDGGNLGVPEGTLPKKIKAIWMHNYATQEQRDIAVSNGINMMITKYGKYGTINELNEDVVREFAIYAKNKNIAFLPVFNFGICPSDFLSTKEKTLYYNGNELKEGVLVPLLNKEYWSYLTEKIKSIAELAKDENLRIDGIKIDFELYNYTIECDPVSNERPYYYSYDGSFDNETFYEFIAENNLFNLNPPITEDRKYERYNWIRDNDKLNNYHTFVREKLQGYAKELKQEINSVNQNFLIGEYPSPTDKSGYYRMIFDVLKGWEDKKPGILFGTETYSGKTTLEQKKVTLTETGDGYFTYKKDFRYPQSSESVKVAYVAGFLLQYYRPENFNIVFENAANSNGYWLFSAKNIFYNCLYMENARRLGWLRLPVNCENDLNNPGCCNQQWDLVDDYWKTNCCQYYEKAKQDFWNAINLTNYRLDCQETNNGVEICDNIDNDCDGQADENLNCNLQTCEQAGFICRNSCFTNETQVDYNCTSGVCCSPQQTERACQERGYFCLPSVNCSSADRLSYNCSSGVCCSKLSNITVQQDKTCLEQSGKICNSTQYCTGAIGWASDGDCCLGECVEEIINITETNKSEFKFDEFLKSYVKDYGFYGIIGILIVLISGISVVTVSKIKKEKELMSLARGKYNKEKIKEAEKIVSMLKRTKHDNDFIKNLFLEKGWPEDIVEKLTKN